LSGTLLLLSISATSEDICRFDVIWSILFNIPNAVLSIRKQNDMGQMILYDRQLCSRHHVTTLLSNVSAILRRIKLQ
jgi:hypothetical protein